MALTLDGLAIGNGILTVENEAQALVRADPAQADKGGDAAKAALALLALKAALRAERQPHLVAPQRPRDHRRIVERIFGLGLARLAAPRQPAAQAVLLLGQPDVARAPGKAHHRDLARRDLDQFDPLGRRRAVRRPRARSASRTASATRPAVRRRTTADRSPSGRRASCITGTVIGNFSPSRDLAKM